MKATNKKKPLSSNSTDEKGLIDPNKKTHPNRKFYSFHSIKRGCKSILGVKSFSSMSFPLAIPIKESWIFIVLHKCMNVEKNFQIPLFKKPLFSFTLSIYLLIPPWLWNEKGEFYDGFNGRNRQGNMIIN